MFTPSKHVFLRVAYLLILLVPGVVRKYYWGLFQLKFLEAAQLRFDTFNDI